MITDNLPRVRIKEEWGDGGSLGYQIGPPVWIQQSWTPVMWDEEEDPNWHKTAGLEVLEVKENWTAGEEAPRPKGS